MARPLKPLVKSGGYYPSNRWTPLVYPGGYTTANGGGQPEPEAVLKTVTGSLIHITDALAKPAQALSVKLEPIQDLHGYDSPWPAGSGKNKGYLLSSNISSDQKDTVVYTKNGVSVESIGKYGRCEFAIPVTIGEQYTVSYKAKKASGDLGLTGIYYGSAPGWNKEYGMVNASSLSTTLSEKTLTFTATSDTFYFGLYPNYKGQAIVVEDFMLESGSSATAFVPYSNICPISGHTDADVTRTGVNVWDEEWEKGTISTTTGENVPGSSGIRTKNYISVIPGESYFIYVGAAGDDNIKARWYDENKNFIGTSPMVHYNSVFTVPNNAHFLRFCPQDSYGATYNHDISINYPSTDHDYHAYTGTTYPIPLGQTVYGGTLDVTTGKLTVDRAIYDFGAGVVAPVNGDEVARTQGLFSAYGFTPTVARVGDISAVTAPDGIICNQFVAAPNNSFLAPGRDPAEASFSQYATSFYVQWSALAGKTNAEAKTLLTGVQILAPLATPITIQLTPTQVELLLGENNLWSDGTMTLVYLADGNASDVEALNILLGNRYVNNHEADEPTDREALDILLGGNTR